MEWAIEALQTIMAATTTTTTIIISECRADVSKVLQVQRGSGDMVQLWTLEVGESQLGPRIISQGPIRRQQPLTVLNRKRLT